MKSCKFSLSMLLTISMICSVVAAQQGASTKSSATVPRLVNFTGKTTDFQGKPIAGIAGVTFAIYKEQYEGTPLWLETHNVQADAKGNYTVQLGATKPDGLPLDLFSSGEARWLGVTVNGGNEQPRVLLLSVPYALKAADAETIGGLPPSAFVLAAPSVSSGAAVNSTNANLPTSTFSSNPPAANVTTSGGTVNALPLWTTKTNIQSSAITQSGTGKTAKLGVNTAKPASTLDVNGAGTVRGNLSLPATGTATTQAGKNSQPTTFTASAYNSNAGTAVPQNFRWQAEPVGNNSANTSGSLNLLFGAGSNPINETGLNIASNGQITFASGQTFPVGNGTITGVTAGNDLTGGGTSGNVTLNLDTTKVPLLGSANTFAANQTVSGAMAATSFSGNGSGLANLQGANVQGAVATANNALDLGGLPPSAYQPAGSYATTGSNSFVGNQNVTGTVSATGSISGGAGTFTGLVTEAGALLPASGTATATQGFNSQPLDSVTSAYNSSTTLAVNEDFRWLAEPVGNDTSSPSGKLDLLFGANGATPAETGFSVASNGQITFASGQVFPGTGTVTSVGLSAPSSDFTVSGSPVTTSGTLGLSWTVAPSSANTANTIVKRDGSGSFSAGNISAVSLTASNPAGLAIAGTTGAPSGAIAGVNTGTSAGSDGVDGVTSSAFAAGVAGINNGGGYGVYGTGGVGVFGSGSTYGFQTDSNVNQARTAGGWVKAMVFVNGYQAPYTIIRCFNSTLPGAAATTPPCGFNLTEEFFGVWIVDFGFQVNDRFVSATTMGKGLTVINVCTSDVPVDSLCTALTSSQVLAWTQDTGGSSNNSYFHLIVY